MKYDIMVSDIYDGAEFVCIWATEDMSEYLDDDNILFKVGGVYTISLIPEYAAHGRHYIITNETVNEMAEVDVGSIFEFALNSNSILSGEGIDNLLYLLAPRRTISEKDRMALSISTDFRKVLGISEYTELFTK